MTNTDTRRGENKQTKRGLSGVNVEKTSTRLSVFTGPKTQGASEVR